MKVKKDLTRSTKDAYWDVVQDCLVEIHQIAPLAASSLCRDRRSAVEFAPKDVRSNIFYHREPFECAYDLAHQLKTTPRDQGPILTDPRTTATYESILARHGLI